MFHLPMGEGLILKLCKVVPFLWYLLQQMVGFTGAILETWGFKGIHLEFQMSC